MEQITTKESQEQLRMAKNMQKFLSETKGIPCKVVNLNEGKKDKEDQEIPGEYEIHSTSGKGQKNFKWKIIFDREDVDDDGKPRRHLVIEEKIDFEVDKNPQLSLIISHYRKPSPKKMKV